MAHFCVNHTLALQRWRATSRVTAPRVMCSTWRKYSFPVVSPHAQPPSRSALQHSTSPSATNVASRTPSSRSHTIAVLSSEPVTSFAGRSAFRPDEGSSGVGENAIAETPAECAPRRAGSDHSVLPSVSPPARLSPFASQCQNHTSPAPVPAARQRQLSAMTNDVMCFTSPPAKEPAAGAIRFNSSGAIDCGAHASALPRIRMRVSMSKESLSVGAEARGAFDAAGASAVALATPAAASLDALESSSPSSTSLSRGVARPPLPGAAASTSFLAVSSPTAFNDDAASSVPSAALNIVTSVAAASASASASATAAADVASFASAAAIRVVSAAAAIESSSQSTSGNSQRSSSTAAFDVKISSVALAHALAPVTFAARTSSHASSRASSRASLPPPPPPPPSLR